ncbi:carbohydrate-binding protein [Streptomyces sp. NPDC001928]|uniref:carbohydrate-binding protein n=1 Tax=Streptomyces sp. NPDC001928 TaxID=3154404 RepID=UPI0033324292
MSPPKAPHTRRLIPPVLLALLCALLYGTAGTAAHAAAATLEAESAGLAGGAVVETEHGGFTGSGYVGGYTDGHKGTASTSFTVSSAAAGAGSVRVRYANGTTATMTLSLYVNGTKVRQIGLPATANWDAWSTTDEAVTYQKGTNTVALTFTTSDSGNVNLDSITPTTPTQDAGTPTLEAESAALSGGAVVETEHGGFTGSGYVGGYTDGHKGTASTSFTVSAAAAGAGSVRVRYANGTTATMTLSLYVNGTKVRQIGLPATANWDAWATADEQVTYQKGTNTVALIFTTSDSGNVNLDSITPTTPTEDAGTLTHEAEQAFISGGAAKAAVVSGYTGSGYLTGFATTGARAAFAVNARDGAATSLDVRYRTPDATDATVTLLANGTLVRRLTLPATSGAWKTLTTDAPLRAGLNNLTLRTASGDNGNLQVDGLDITSADANATRGATLPYTTYEAEDAATNGSVTGPDRTYLTTASEASGRKAVVLDRTGAYVRITLTKPANALTLRYSLPDSTTGTPYEAPLSVYADGNHVRDLTLTNRYSWVYGSYPFTNDPAQGSGHHFFDEVRAKLGSTLPAGTVLTLQKDATDTAGSYTLDLVETETAPDAYPMPSGFVSATTLGVTPDDGGDDTAALNSAVNTAKGQGKGLWLPSGTYNISGEISLTGIDLRGAGPWYTVLRGKDGKGVLFGRGGTNTVQDLAVNGDVTYRDDTNFDTGIEGDFGSGSTVQNVWIEHTKTGVWLDAPTKGMYLTGLRIRDTMADGANLHKGTTGTEISNSSIRGTGDDALAMFSEQQAVTDCAFRFNTVQLPLLANGAAIYGGSGNSIQDNLIADTVTSSAGIAISTRNFPPAPLPFSGTTTVARNTLTRTGGYEPNWQSKFGALWIYADSSDITAPVDVLDNDILDSTYSAVLVSYQKTVRNLTVTNLKIDKTGHHGIEINSAGSGTFSGVTVTGTAAGGLSLAGGFTVTRGTGNSGW